MKTIKRILQKIRKIFSKKENVREIPKDEKEVSQN